jgi:hypothetical protein
MVNGQINEFNVVLNIGAELALREINYLPFLLNGYDLVYEELNLGVLFFIPQLAEPIFATSLDKLGVCMFGAQTSDLTFGILALEAKYNKFTPKIFPLPMISQFSNPQAAPMFNRVVMNS